MFKRYGLILVCFVIASKLNAHPHLFIESRVVIHIDNKGIAGIENIWIFDEMFSVAIIEEQDKNKDGYFDATEIKTIRKEAFQNLKDYDYFTHIRIDGKSFKVEDVKNFVPTIKNKKLVYTFLVPCQVEAVKQDKKIEISIFDTSYYTGITIVDDKPKFKGKTDKFKLAGKITRDENFVFMDQEGFPETITIKIRTKNEE